MEPRPNSGLIAAIRQQGNQLDGLRLRRALGQPFTQAEAESILSPYQFPDGSWDYSAPGEQPERIGSLGGTIHCLRWLREFGLGEGPQIARTLDFLASIQAEDGSFYETEAKLAHSPQEWLNPDTLVDRFYFAAAVPMRLFSLGHGEHPTIALALRWLAGHWDDWALVTGTWYNLWALLCIYPEHPQPGAALYQRCRVTALEWLPELKAQPLTWLLDALHGAAYPADDPLVAKGMACLLALRGEDSTWQTPDDPGMETTVTALRLLHDYRSIPGLGNMNGPAEAWEMGFRQALVQEDLPRAVHILERRNKSSGTPPGSDKVKALRLVEQRILDPDEAYGWAMRLLQSESAAARSLGAMLVPTFIERFYAQHPRQAQELMVRIADDAHWEVREDANAVLLPLLRARFDETVALLRQWTRHPSENVRRAVVLTVKKAGRERRPEWGKPLLDLLEPLLGDRSVYVRKNLGPFAIGDGLLRCYPALTLGRLACWAGSDDAQVRWNVVMAFSTAEGARHVDAALPILERMAGDGRRFVWRAVASAMRNLGKRAPERVVPMLNEWLENERLARPAEAALRYLPRFPPPNHR
jgi:3-methyladenine DNA glycosylase AlkC